MKNHNCSDIDETENIVDSEALLHLEIREVPQCKIHHWISEKNIIKFINVFYEYRHQLTYNSRLIVIYARVTYYDMKKEWEQPLSPRHRFKLSCKGITNDYMSSVLKVTKLHESWCKGNPCSTYRHHPVAALLTLKNDEIIPFDISHLNDMIDLGSGYNSYNFDNKFAFETFNIGSALFKINYLYDPSSNTIKMNSFSKTQVPLTLVDFISANKPSLKHFIDESNKYTRYFAPILYRYINDHLREILSEQCSKEVLDLYDEQFKYILTFTYISKRTLDRDAKLKRKAELEAELKQIETELI